MKKTKKKTVKCWMDPLEAIKAAMSRQKKSEAQLSRDTGIAQKNLNSILLGKMGMTMRTYRRLADTLGLVIVDTVVMRPPEPDSCWEIM